MAVSTVQSQSRAVDPFASYNSNIVNQLTRVITRNRNCIHQQTDFSVTPDITLPLSRLVIGTGILFISDVYIEVNADFTVDFLDPDYYEPATIPIDSTGEYLLTIKYEFSITQPPPEGNIVILKPDQYALFKATNSPYLLYKVVNVILNGSSYEIDSLTDAHSTDPDIKRVYSELEERLIAAESSLNSGSVSAVPNSLVLRDSNADIYGNDFYGNLVGSADTLSTPRNIALTGDILGNIDFDGSQDVSISTEIVNKEFNIIIDSTAGNFISFSDYLVGSPQVGDRVLINEDQTLSSRINIPEGILIRLLKGKKFIVPETYSDTQVVVFNNRSDSEGNLYFELRHTGAITTAISFNGLDNHHENIVLDNTGIGTIDDVFKIEADKIGNFAKGELIRTDPSLIINSVLNDNSGSLSNDIIIRERSYFVWISRDSKFGTESIYGVVHNGTDLWVVVGSSGLLSSSSDGISWISQISEFASNAIYGIGSDSTSWISCGVNGTLATSPNAINWTLQDMSTTFGSNAIYDVIYDYTNSQWIAVGANSLAARSIDGTSWSNITITGFSGSDSIRDITYGNGVLVAVGSTGKISTSTDGINWTIRSSGLSSQIRGVDFDSINNLWIAVGDLGKVTISNDTITWTPIDVSSVFGINTITAISHNGIDLWVAVGQNGIMATCKNGIDWIIRYSNFGSSMIYDIWFEIDKWVAVGQSGKLSTSNLITS